MRLAKALSVIVGLGLTLLIFSGVGVLGLLAAFMMWLAKTLFGFAAASIVLIVRWSLGVLFGGLFLGALLCVGGIMLDSKLASKYPDYRRAREKEVHCSGRDFVFPDEYEDDIYFDDGLDLDFLDDNEDCG